MEDKYYEQIKEELINNETYSKVKDYSKNKHDLKTRYTVGKLLIEAQGGEKRAKYGDNLIKEYSKRLTNDLGKNYDTTSLKRMRKFYLIIQKGAPVGPQLTWSHYRQLLKFDDINEINYYVNECIKNNLSKRDLEKKIKENDYKRLDNITKNKLINNDTISLTDFIKDSIIIKNKYDHDELSEKELKLSILENIDEFLKELGDGFSYIANEYKIKIGSNYHYIDILLFNYKFNLFVVVELKITKLRSEYIGQIQKYMNYIDKNLKNNNQDNTIGIIICKINDYYIMEYCSDDKILSRKYILK